MSNFERFVIVLTDQYRQLFDTDPEYALAKSRYTPEALALKMAEGLKTGASDKDGTGVKRACKALGLKCTYTALRVYLTA